MGVRIDVGEFPSYIPTDEDASNDPERPVRLVSHAVARIADRVGPLRKLSRHLEGRESKAGLVSDLLSAGFDIYNRNSQEVDQLIVAYVNRAREKTAARQQAGSGGVRTGRFGRNTQTAGMEESQ